MSNYVVVIDPGHGSMEYPGGQYDGYVEKDIDLVVASVMKDRLEKYDGVTVYMTRYDDSNVELHDRAKVAKNCNADLFVSIHFNTSATHSTYGSELWIPAQNKYYNKVFPLANEMMKNFEAVGLHNRGIKTKLNSAGTDNYYAVLKDSTDYGIPSILVEHCHLDNPFDTFAIPIYDTQAYLNNLNNFGVMDADAVAKYLHLKSTSLGLDYSNYKLTKSNVKTKLISQDYTAPESCEVSLISTNVADQTISVNIKAKDTNGFIQYYQYSVDGGAHWSYLQDWPRTAWNKSAENCQATIKVKPGATTSLIVFVYNGYDLVTASNVLAVPALTGAPAPESEITINKTAYQEFSGISYGTLERTSTSHPLDLAGGEMMLTFAGALAGLTLAASILLAYIKHRFSNEKK